MDPELPEVQLDEEPLPPSSRSIGQILALPYDAELSEIEEQALRDHLGYGASEKRTRKERSEAAKRAVIQAKKDLPVRRDGLGQEVVEPVGPAGLSLVAFPVQRKGDLTPKG